MRLLKDATAMAELCDKTVHECKAALKEAGTELDGMTAEEKVEYCFGDYPDDGWDDDWGDGWNDPPEKTEAPDAPPDAPLETPAEPVPALPPASETPAAGEAVGEPVKEVVTNDDDSIAVDATDAAD